MTSKLPIVKQVSWLSIIPQLGIIVLLMYVLHLAGVKEPIFPGAIIYLLLSLGLKNLIPRNHRKGMRLFKRKSFQDAIYEFQKSYEFFKKHKWVDTYRSVILLSSSRISYTEMALVNIAFCYGQTGEGQKSREYYERTLQKFPESEIARAALNMLDSSVSNPLQVNKGKNIE